MRLVSYDFLPSGVATRPRNASWPSAFCASTKGRGVAKRQEPSRAPSPRSLHPGAEGNAGRVVRAGAACCTHVRPARDRRAAGAIQGGEEGALADDSQAGLLVVQGGQGSSCV